ncbi:WcbI family polysaccharide biosynthesis putative acetyltransferase [Roseicyclus marinus]|uniref:WcbI family polysaccharide biosynthesis putative acetyltransferase n=1 Tax=Roseicyclus marinus TaxID=2161673 RepID=UPI002410434B|nr:WcbI family polysaccharide biosynthesis putative acetyltransferase [Roseicyclus marinus]MDG3040953.1 WcbI family polysaccharide biosynthesis putative acetyltransferase [Roseicyclus marinus]
MKVLVIGNCQARPLSSILGNVPDIEVLPPIILHLAKESDRPDHEETFNKADWVIAQATSIAFKPEHLQSIKIKERFGDRATIWPNIFFLGQTPRIRYITHIKHGRIFGPLDAYHDLQILNDWLSQNSYSYLDQNLFDYDEISKRSLADLQMKEAMCDVKISDLILENYRKAALFFTFNHPTQWLLEAMGRRVLAEKRIELTKSTQPKEEPLGKIRPHSIFSKTDSNYVQYHGIATIGQEQGKKKMYSFNSLRDEFFLHYDRISDNISNPNEIIFTPQY